MIDPVRVNPWPPISCVKSGTNHWAFFSDERQNLEAQGQKIKPLPGPVGEGIVSLSAG